MLHTYVCCTAEMPKCSSSLNVSAPDCFFARAEEPESTFFFAFVTRVYDAVSSADLCFELDM